MQRPSPDVLVVRDPDAAQAALHPLRRRLLDLLRTPASASDLAEHIGLSRQKVNYHVRRLEEAGLVETVSERRKGNVMERIVRAVASRFLLSPELLPGGPSGSDDDDRYSSARLLASAARSIREVAPLREAAHSVGKKVPALVLEREVRLARPADQQAFAAALEEAVDRVIEACRAPEGEEEGTTFRIALQGHPRPPGRKG